MAGARGRVIKCDLLVAISDSTMTLDSTSDSPSIFEGGRVKPGVYKIQNLYHQGYLDIAEHSRELRCFPARDLENGKGLVRLRL